MQVNTHARLMKAYHWVIPTLSIVMVCFGALGLMSGNAGIVRALIFFALAGGAYYLLLWFLPVHCKAPGCNGRVKWTLTQVSDWAPVVKSKLEYRCTVCNDLYETGFSHIPFSVSGESGPY